MTTNVAVFIIDIGKIEGRAAIAGDCAKHIWPAIAGFGAGCASAHKGKLPWPLVYRSNRLCSSCVSAGPRRNPGPALFERPTPSAWTYADHAREHSRQVALISKTAGRGHIRERHSSIAQVLLGHLDAAREQPLVRWQPCCTVELA